MPLLFASCLPFCESANGFSNIVMLRLTSIRSVPWMQRCFQEWRRCGRLRLGWGKITCNGTRYAAPFHGILFWEAVHLKRQSKLPQQHCRQPPAFFCGAVMSPQEGVSCLRFKLANGKRLASFGCGSAFQKGTRLRRLGRVIWHQ